MRIDRSTEIFNIGEKKFLVNFKTGAIDEVEDYIIKEVNRLNDRSSSFTSLECKLKEALIEEMIERGYITYYSDKEEADEKRWAFERYKEKVKKEKKTISILLDSIVGSKWCSSEANSQIASTIENLSMSITEIGNVLKVISKGKLADEINLWLIIKNRVDDWELIKEEIHENGLRIKNLYTFAENETELEEIKNWLNISILSSITINVKYKSEYFGYISLSKLNEKNITVKRRIVFLGNHPFFCPFIYRTFFVDEGGNISYCVKKLINKDWIGKINTITGQVDLENGWGKELFANFCEKSEDCIYSIYCQKMCPFIGSLYENRRGVDECSIVTTIKTVMQEKIRSMM